MIKLLVPDIEEFNELEAKRRDEQLKATFNFKKFKEDIASGIKR